MTHRIPMIRLPAPLAATFQKFMEADWRPASPARHNFSLPMKEAGLIGHASVSWRVFKNPVALFIGGVAAVILELADPQIRSAIWQHSTFRQDPLGRLRRTGAAALTTIYGPRSVAEPMIARVVRMHARVRGTTPAGVSFCANDPDLLRWVHVTATYAFSEAYHRYVEALSPLELDSVCQESMPVSRLYGIDHVPESFAATRDLMEARRGNLEASPAVHEFLRIMQHAPLLPVGLRWLQGIAVRGAVQLLPRTILQKLELSSEASASRSDLALVRMGGALANRLVLPSSAACQACIRLGLPVTYLYR